MISIQFFYSKTLDYAGDDLNYKHLETLGEGTIMSRTSQGTGLMVLWARFSKDLVSTLAEPDLSTGRSGPQLLCKPGPCTRFKGVLLPAISAPITRCLCICYIALETLACHIGSHAAASTVVSYLLQLLTATQICAILPQNMPDSVSAGTLAVLEAQAQQTYLYPHANLPSSPL